MGNTGKRIYCGVFILFGLTFSTWGQTSFEIQTEPLNRTVSQRDDIEKNFSEYKTYKIKNTFSLIQARKLKDIELIINLDKEYRLKVQENALCSKAILVKEEFGKTINDTISLENYFVATGYVEGEVSSSVRLVFDSLKITGSIIVGKKLIGLEPIAKDEIIVYEFDSYHDKTFKCGVEEKPLDNHKSESVETGLRTTQNNPCRVMEIACEGDFEFYQIFGSNSVSRILSIMNNVENAYSPFNLKFSIPQIIIFTTSNDPYNSTNLSTRLDEFTLFWLNTTSRQKIPRDYAHLFSGYNDTSRWGVAWIYDACTNPSKSFATTRDRNLDFLKTYLTTTHEIGHNLGLEHSNGNCTNPVSIMCGDPGVFGTFAYWNNSETSKLNSSLSASNCLTHPNVIPTVNGNIYTGTVNLCNWNNYLSLNNFSSSASFSWFVDPANLSGNGNLYPNGGNAAVNVWNFYRVVGQITDKCGYTNNTFFYLNPCSNYRKFNIYPNPSANENLNIELDIIGNGELRILDQKGNILKTIFLEEGSHKVQIDKDLVEFTNQVNFIEVIDKYGREIKRLLK